MEIKDISRKLVRFSEEDTEALEKVQDILQTIRRELDNNCVLETQETFFNATEFWEASHIIDELLESDEIWIGN